MFEIQRTKDGQYWWHLKAANGEVLCHSETYTTKQAAMGGVAAVKKLAPDAGTTDLT